MAPRYAYPFNPPYRRKGAPNEGKLHDGLLTTAGLALKAETGQRLERKKK